MYATNKKFALLLQAFINTVNKISGKFLLKLTAFLHQNWTDTLRFVTTNKRSQSEVSPHWILHLCLA
jgi:hypothetical protein